MGRNIHSQLAPRRPPNYGCERRIEACTQQWRGRACGKKRKKEETIFLNNENNPAARWESEHTGSVVIPVIVTHRQCRGLYWMRRRDL